MMSMSNSIFKQQPSLNDRLVSYYSNYRDSMDFSFMKCALLGYFESFMKLLPHDTSELRRKHIHGLSVELGVLANKLDDEPSFIEDDKALFEKSLDLIFLNLQVISLLVKEEKKTNSDPIRELFLFEMILPRIGKLLTADNDKHPLKSFARLVLLDRIKPFPEGLEEWKKSLHTKLNKLEEEKNALSSKNENNSSINISTLVLN